MDQRCHVHEIAAGAARRNHIALLNEGFFELECSAMSLSDSNSAVERLRLAFDLYAAGEEMMRQSLIRRHPEADKAEIESLLVRWLRHRPGAEMGDAIGRPVPPERWPS